MRLFVALSIPAEARENLSSLISDLRHLDEHLRWVHPKNMHVTLKFIGEVRSENVAAMGDALETVRTAQRVDLRFGNIGFFPDARRASVAWIAIEASPLLALLAAEVNRVLTPLGMPREAKPFVPHLTIARLRGSRPSPALLAQIETPKERNFGAFRASEFQLIESELKSAGAEYTTLRSFRFAPEREGQEP
jgi:2'-5' RNA ligase